MNIFEFWDSLASPFYNQGKLSIMLEIPLHQQAGLLLSDPPKEI
jgi:hypothetical protein